MSTTIRYIFVSTLCVIILACARIEEIAPVSQDGVELTLTAVREGYDPSTRTVRLEDGSVEWCPSEEISVFYNNGSDGGSKFVSQNDEDVPVAEFVGKLNGVSAGGEGFVSDRYIYGIYPYSQSTSFSDGVATIILPSYQTSSEGTFSNNLFPTIGRSKGLDIAFYNICGGVKFTVSRDDITSVVFKGNSGERLAGAAKVAFDSSSLPTVLSEEVESATEITVFAPAGGTFEIGKEYYIVAYPVKLDSGFTLTFRTSSMKEGVYIHPDAVEIKRSVFGVLDRKDVSVDSWNDISDEEGGGESDIDSGIYLGIVGFNQQLYTYPISSLTSASKSGFESFIDNLKKKNGTLLYYSVDQAMNMMQSFQYPANLETVAIVTFTDGLDQGSMMMDVPYVEDSEYLSALNNRIKNETFNGKSLQAYSIGIRGQDVADVSTFRKNLSYLASSQENAIEVTSMDEVNQTFRDISRKLSYDNYLQTINIKMPGVSNGTRVRFTFDAVSSALSSRLYIEGVFDLTSHSLKNVRYNGMSCASGTEIKGVVDDIFVTFTFEDIQTDYRSMIKHHNIDEWTYNESTNVWQINSEFDKEENTDIINERGTALIVLVLDCSSSLADDFSTVQSNAKDFVNTLYDVVAEEDDSVTYPTAVNLSSSGTSNCYVVSHPGTYKFKTVKGNSCESVGSVAEAEVLWESFGTRVTPEVRDLVKSVRYTDGVICFETAAVYKEGNAVIAVKDASGKILWSWHIWFTDQPQGQAYYNYAGTMMDRNLGATSATPGDVGALGLLYQWGRKDPFLGSSSISSSISAKSTICPSTVQGDNNTGTIEYASANPTTFIANSRDWCISSDEILWTESTSPKSIYDPCPVGWRVPDNGVWTTALDSSRDFYDNSISDEYNFGVNFSGILGSANSIWYPQSGDRDTGGSLGDVDDSGRYWSASSNGSSSAKCLDFSSDGYVWLSYEYRVRALSVRCFQESSVPTYSPSRREVVNLSKDGTSNCYIVSEAGSYEFTPTKGNSNKSVGSIASAEVLWESYDTDVTPNKGDLVKNVRYESGVITFRTNDSFKEGNAVIAAKDADGKILWSWHIWLTDQPDGQVYYNGAGIVMDRNLGATSANPRTSRANGLLYQWGRKDPFLGAYQISSYSGSYVLEKRSTISWPSSVPSNSSNGTILYATANPTTFITSNSSNHDWYYTGSSSTDNTRWATFDEPKSIYDPCPAGWRVPDGGENGLWSKALGLGSSLGDLSYDSTNKGINFFDKFGSALIIWYPASGYRNDRDGYDDFKHVGNSGYYWSASPNGNSAFNLYFSYDNVYISDYSNRAYGLSVRCLKE